MSSKLKTVIAAAIVALAIGDLTLTMNAPSTLPAARAASESAAATTAAAAEVGKKAPDFKLTDSNGKTHSLSDHKGKFVVLEWINFDCPFVKKHYSSGNMQKLQDTYKKKGVTWLAINSSASGRQGNYPPAKINAILKEQNARPDAYLIDAEGTVGTAYGAKATPHMFVIDPDGKLIYAGAIDDNNSADPEDAPKAKNYVAAALDAAMSKKPVATANTKAYGCSVKYQTKQQ